MLVHWQTRRMSSESLSPFFPFKHSFVKGENSLDYSFYFPYNIGICKDYDEDSRIYPKVQANRGRCEPGTSRVYLNITSELQLPNHLQ